MWTGTQECGTMGYGDSETLGRGDWNAKMQEGGMWGLRNTGARGLGRYLGDRNAGCGDSGTWGRRTQENWDVGS